MPTLTIRVELLGGSDIEDVAVDMVELASRLDVMVLGIFNGIDLTALPFSDPRRVRDRYRNALASQTGGET